MNPIAMLGTLWAHATRGERLFLVWLASAYCILTVWEFVAFDPSFLYFFLWTLGVGGCLFTFRGNVRALVRALPLGSFPRFIVIGAVMVLAEETVAALVNSAKEGFSVGLWLQRIPQFWLFNLLVFLPLFLGWYLIASHLPYTLREAVFLTGAIGILAEHILLFWLTDPLLAAVFSPIEVATYAGIALPSLLSLPLPLATQRPWPRWARYALMFVVPILLAFVGGSIAESIRAVHPGWFPPRSEIP